MDVIKFFVNNCHLPISVGGGISSLEKAQRIFNLGVEKIILSSSTYYNSSLTKDLVTNFGSSSIIQSIDFKKGQDDKYSIFVDNGKTIVNQNTIDYIKHLIKLGTGEILLNSIDNDGGLLGFDINFIESFSSYISAPIIVQGGGGSWSHFYDVFKFDCVSAVCTQNIYHFTETSLKSAKKYLKYKNIEVRFDY